MKNVMIIFGSLNFIGVLAYSTASSTFGQGIGPVFLSNLYCDGTESSLLNCSRTVFVGSYCTHDRDVGVRCERKYYQYNACRYYYQKLRKL